jgi:uncharacterized protein (TIGR02284 family)
MEQSDMWTVATATDIGGRDSQQDRVEVFSSEDGNEILAVLADGMGGHTGGGLAADVVVETAREYWKKHVTKPMPPVELLNAICNEAHTLTKEMGDERDQEPHTTYVALHLDHHTANWAHVGDSRFYLFRDGVLEHRTKDDSLVQTLVTAGDLAEADMSEHPDSNVVLESVGGNSRPTANLGHADVANRDAFLLCSDGLWNSLKSEEIGQLVHDEPAATAIRAMITLAVDRAGAKADNTTAALIRMDEVAVQEAEMQPSAIMALQELIAVCRDSCMALGEAVEHIQDRDLQRTFKEMLADRAVVRDNLIAGLGALGAVPDEGGTAAGATIRIFSRFKTAVLKNDQVSVINTLEAAEDRIKNKFLDTLKLRLPLDAQRCIHNELGAVLAAHDLASTLKYANK